MTTTELNKRYQNIPQELKSLKRWVGYKVETLASGKQTKRPYNALSGMLARVNDSITWSTFNLALSGCEKFNFDGIGFVLGNGIFGVDLDNHADENTPEEDIRNGLKAVKAFILSVKASFPKALAEKAVLRCMTKTDFLLLQEMQFATYPYKTVKRKLSRFGRNMYIHR